MSEIKKILRCYKCGEILQDSDENKEGYILSEVYQNHTSDILLCNKCFEKTIFNNKPQVNDFDPDLYTILRDAEATGALVVLVIDIFSFEGFTNKKFLKAIGGCNVLVIANKIDLLPKNVDREYLTEYVKHRLRVQGMNVGDVYLTSYKDPVEDIAIIKQEINKKRNRCDVFLIGLPHSGKTTISNIFLKYFNNSTKRVIKTELYPDTNTQVVSIPLDRTSTMYDVPGFYTRNAVNEIVEKSVAMQIIPTKTIEPRRLTLGENEAFFFGGLASVQLLSRRKTQVVVYASNKIDVEKISKKNINDAFIKSIENGEYKPTSKFLVSNENFDIYDIETDEEDMRDIGILGLGWFSFEGHAQKFRLTVPKGTYVYFSRAKVKYVKK